MHLVSGSRTGERHIVPVDASHDVSYLHPIGLSDVGIPLYLWRNSILSGREEGGMEGGGERRRRKGGVGPNIKETASLPQS